jgi:DNA ligase-1
LDIIDYAHEGGHKPVNFEVLVDASEKIRSTARKTEKIALIAGMLRQARGKEISLVAQFLSGTIPTGRLGIGWSTIRDATEDLNPARSPVSLSQTAAYLEDLAKITGPGSSARKKQKLRELFSKLTDKGRRFLAGLLLGDVRQGALEGLVLEAIAQVASLPLADVRRAYMFSGDIGEVAEAALRGGASGLDRFGPRLFSPISPMLASPVGGEKKALERLGEASWEYKIDGARIQVHKAKNDIHIFTRHLNEVTERLPEIVSLAKKFPAREAILDGEAIALRKNGKPEPFQTTMRRFGRILEVERMQREIPLSPYFFDILYLDGRSLLDLPYSERMCLLGGNIPARLIIPHTITGSARKAHAFLLRSMAAGHEGVMAKGIESHYAAGQRGFHWLKIKPARTLDLVVLAAEWGHGRRRGWLSNIHLGARDPGSGQFIMLGKTFKGLTDEMLTWMTKRLLELETRRDEYTVYVRPELVAEIAFSDIQESPRYPGGLALRFARVKSFRPEKSAAEADTIKTVWSIFKAQRQAG